MQSMMIFMALEILLAWYLIHGFELEYQQPITRISLRKAESQIITDNNQ
jgi:hypothetical protein